MGLVGRVVRIDAVRKVI